MHIAGLLMNEQSVGFNLAVEYAGGLSCYVLEVNLNQI